jgi:hypothetical protein
MGNTVIDLLVGRKVKVNTDMKVVVTLEIQSIKPKQHSVEITPSTRENDWWGESQDWTTYIVKFTNGATKEYSSLESIEVE